MSKVVFISILNIAFIIIVIAGSLYFFYYFKTIKEKSQRLLFELCLSTARERYTLDWNAACRALGEEKGCDLPSFLSDPIEKGYQNEKNDCFKKYPQEEKE